MINKFSIIYIFTLSLLFTQESVNYDMSGQFGVELSNNQILWDRDQRFDNLLIDKSSTNFRNKFSSFDFEDMPSDSVYVKSKFRYEFGDYGFDRLNIGLKKHSENTDFQFLAMKKSFFGNYSEFANADSAPLSLFYKIDTNISLNAFLILLIPSFSYAIALFLQLLAIPRIGQTNTALFLYLEPITGIFGAVIILNENLSPIQLLGTVIVLLSLASSTFVTRQT